VLVPSLASLAEKTMPTAEHYDLLVIGSGEAGKVPRMDVVKASRIQRLQKD
jgi:hypothetical protein